MKTAVVTAEGITQVMLTPENEHEKKALEILGEHNKTLSIDFKKGSFYSGELPPSAFGFRVEECQNEFLRAYQDSESLMIVVRSNEKN